jgi:hypothetical protein
MCLFIYIDCLFATFDIDYGNEMHRIQISAYIFRRTKFKINNPQQKKDK